MPTFIVEFESNIYNMSHAYGEPKTVTAENIGLARLWAESYIAATPERSNVAIKSINTPAELIAKREVEIARLSSGYLDAKPELRDKLIGYERAAIARLQGVAA